MPSRHTRGSPIHDCVAPAVDTSAGTLKREHREVLAVIHRAAGGEDTTAAIARDLEIAMLPHLKLEERLEADLAGFLEAPLVPGATHAGLPSGLTLGTIIRRLEILRIEHRNIRHLAKRLRESAAREGHTEVACTCGRLLAHIAVEDGVVYPLAKMQAKLSAEEARQRAPTPPA